MRITRSPLCGEYWIAVLGGWELVTSVIGSSNFLRPWLTCGSIYSPSEVESQLKHPVAWATVVNLRLIAVKRLKPSCLTTPFTISMVEEGPRFAVWCSIWPVSNIWTRGTSSLIGNATEMVSLHFFVLLKFICLLFSTRWLRKSKS